jgi:hypothetical protein
VLAAVLLLFPQRQVLVVLVAHLLAAVAAAALH